MTEIAAQDATVRTSLSGAAATSRAQSHGFMRLTEGRPEWVVNAAIIVIISTLVSLFLGTAGLIHGGGDYGELVNKLISGWVWVPLVPLILAIDRRLPLSESQFPLRLAFHFGLSLPGAALHTAILALADYPFKIIWFSPIRSPQNTYYFLFADWFSYWAIFALIDAEELGITSANLSAMESRQDPDGQAFFATMASSSHELAPGWAAAAVRSGGNYGEIFARNLGPQSRARLERGLNKSWIDGGLLYAPPIR